MTRMDEIEDRFYREVDIVRESGGFAPTTDDLRWLGEQRAYAAMENAAPLPGGGDEPPIRARDRYGVEWDLPPSELCPGCGQPDNCGDCDHTPLSAEEVAELKGEEA